MLVSVSALSDDEDAAASPKGKRQPFVSSGSKADAKPAGPVKRKASSLHLVAKDPALMVAHVSKLVSKRCPSAVKAKKLQIASCYSKFREDRQFTALTSLRKELVQLSKEDADRKVT